jgi:hypothetical protein
LTLFKIFFRAEISGFDGKNREGKILKNFENGIFGAGGFPL